MERFPSRLLHSVTRLWFRFSPPHLRLQELGHNGDARKQSRHQKRRAAARDERVRGEKGEVRRVHEEGCDCEGALFFFFFFFGERLLLNKKGTAKVF